MALNDVPLSGQTLGITQPLIKNNFSTINAAFAIDHIEYIFPGTGGNQGKHKKVTFPVQGAAFTFMNGDIGLYNLNYTPTTSNELFVAKTGGTGIPMTASLQSANGWTYLPSGILLKWGQSPNLTGNAWTQVVFPSGGTIPAFTNVFSVQVSAQVITPQPSTAETTASMILNTTFSNTGFYVFNRRTDAGLGYLARCTYLAIGI